MADKSVKLTSAERKVVVEALAFHAKSYERGARSAATAAIEQAYKDGANTLMALANRIDSHEIEL